jgi:hypothetical protein
MQTNGITKANEAMTMAARTVLNEVAQLRRTADSLEEWANDTLRKAAADAEPNGAARAHLRAATAAPLPDATARPDQLRAAG